MRKNKARRCPYNRSDQPEKYQSWYYKNVTKKSKKKKKEVKTLMQDKRAVIFCITILLLAGTVVGYAAVPQSTIQTTVPGGITTYVGHYGNFTRGLWIGVMK